MTSRHFFEAPLVTDIPATWCGYDKSHLAGEFGGKFWSVQLRQIWLLQTTMPEFEFFFQSWFLEPFFVGLLVIDLPFKLHVTKSYRLLGLNYFEHLGWPHGEENFCFKAKGHTSCVFSVMGSWNFFERLLMIEVSTKFHGAISNCRGLHPFGNWAEHAQIMDCF